MRTGVLVMLLWALSANGQGLKYVPKWRLVNDLGCYTLDETKTLVLLDAEHAACAEKQKLYQQQVSALEAETYDLREALAASERQAAIWRTTATEQQQAYNRCITDKTKCQSDAAPGIGWFVAGALVLVGVGMAVGWTVLH